jgi:hypothetical protein
MVLRSKPVPLQRPLLADLPEVLHLAVVTPPHEVEHRMQLVVNSQQQHQYHPLLVWNRH